MKRHALYRYNGFALWDVAVFIMLAAGVAAASFTVLQSQTLKRQSAAQETLLDWADRQTRGFAASHGRLPCPDVDGDGLENCDGAVQSGWLPHRTLGYDGAMRPTPGGPRLRYVVYRTGGLDLARPGNHYEPARWDGTPFGFNAVNDLDLCAALARAGSLPADAQAAHVLAPGGAFMNVSFAIAVPGAGDRDGDGNPYDGGNGSTGVELESPWREVSSQYDDRVRGRGFVDLANAMGCGMAMAAIDGMAMAVDVSDEVNSQKIYTLAGASVLTLINGVKVAVLGLKIYNAGALMTTAATVLSVANAALAAAIGTCAVLVGCAEIPHAAASVAAATVAVTAAATAMGLNTAAIIPQSIATAMTLAITIQAGLELTPASLAEALQNELGSAPLPPGLASALQNGLVVAPDTESITDTLATMKAKVETMEADAATAEAKAVTARTGAAQAWNTVEQARAEVIATADEEPRTDAFNPGQAYSDLDAVLFYARSWVDAQAVFEDAKGRYEAAQLKADKLGEAVAELEAQAAANPGDVNIQRSLADARAQRDQAQAEVMTLQGRKNTAQSATSSAESTYLAARETALAHFPAKGDELGHDLDGGDQQGGYLKAYADYKLADMEALAAESSASQTRQSATALRRAYEDMKAAYESADNSASGSPLSVWGGSRNILQGADAMGVYP